MDVLVIGGAGYVGIECVRQLLNDKAVNTVGIYDNFTRESFEQVFRLFNKFSLKLSVYQNELLDTHSLKRVIKKYDSIIYLAGVTGTVFTDLSPNLFEQVNHWGTAGLVSVVEDAHHVKQLSFLSSASVYGSGDLEFSPGDNTNPVCSYGQSKLRAENQLFRLSDKIQLNIFRSATVFGLNSCARFDSFLNKFIFCASTKQKLILHGDGSQVRPVVHLNEVVATLVNALFTVENEQIKNVCQFNVSVKEIVNTLDSLIEDVEYSYVNKNMSFRNLSLAITESKSASLRDILLDELSLSTNRND